MRYIVTLLVTDDIPETIQAECTVEKQSIVDVGDGYRGIVGRVESVTIATEATCEPANTSLCVIGITK